MFDFRRIRRPIAALLLVLHLPACYHYVAPDGMAPQEYIAARKPSQVHVTLTDGSRMEMLRPWASTDSLGGLRLVPLIGGGHTSGAPVSVPRRGVQRLEVYRLNTGTTLVGVTAALAAAVAATVALMALTSAAGAAAADIPHAVDCALSPFGCD